MAVTINASTTAGLVQTADTSGVLALQTAGTTAVTVDASQNVGIGVTPSAWSATKAVEVGSLGTALWSSGAGSTTLSNGAYYNSGWKYANGTSKPSLIDFDNGGKLTYYAATATSTAGSAISLTQLLAVEAGKSIALQGATVQTGTGITFPATQSASTDANTLDDYEEGTWTVTVTPSTGSLTAYNQAGQYTKVGRLVTLNFYFQITTIGTAGGAATITGLPFSAATSAISAGSASENAVSGVAGVVHSQSTTSLLVKTATGGTPFIASAYWMCAISYFS
jgi:hypothetical protein